ncbi:MAG TPA: Tex-like N-terminal domain-containing protein, partial [Prolixibacteraceae bacterium]|nr:Tex-like N-terminal domain-containing protein [Prolixibacteraceae bacterium]
MLGIQDSQVKNTIDLLGEGATVPFISRYRKERTGSLDEV